MEVENVARIGLAAGRTLEDEGDLAVGYGLLGEVVIDDERVAPRVAELLPDGGSGERRVVLQRRRVGGRRGHDYRVVHRPFGAEGVDYARDC